MTTPTPSVPRLRKLLLKFYQENDPVVLNQGFDINGLVKFTSEKGIDVVNRMLFKKYGKAIDVNEDLGSAKQAFNRMSQALTTSTVIVKKEQEFRQKLFQYFSKHNPALTSPAQAKKFETMVKFAMLNGLGKLSDKLRGTYGEPIEGAYETGGDDNMMVDVDNGDLGDKNENKFKLDIPRLQKDLEGFYNEMEDYEQLEVLEEMTNWACEIGIEEFDKKLQQLYGQSLNQYNESMGKELHFNYTEQKAPQEPPTPARDVPAVPSRDGPPSPQMQTVYETVTETVMEPGVERDFEDMSDEEVTAELRAFYTMHDPDNLGNLPKVLQVARKMGRETLNAQLMTIYEDKLKPQPVERVIERQVAKQVPLPVERSMPPVPNRGVPVVPMSPPGGDITMPVRREMPKFGAAVVNNDMMGEMMGRMQNQPKVDVEAEMRRQKEEEERRLKEERLARMPAFQRKALEMRERTLKGESIVRDAQGNVMKVNLLIEVCKLYELDPLSGVCKKCEFAVSDHFYGIKKKTYDHTV